ncbi:hypothetical protein LLG95_16205 [bacterium]|nr:hypothetical protein [bacterium]
MRTRNDGRIRRAGWTFLAAMTLIGVANAQSAPGLTPTNAKVDVSTISPKDPHPTVYSWDGKIESINQPKTYYTFFYTGTVQPDARVPDDGVITRVPVKLNEWADNKRWIIAQLTMFYQAANNLPTTALQEYQAGPQPTTPAPGTMPPPQQQQQTQPTTPQPQTSQMPPQGFQPGGPPQFGGPGQQQTQAPPQPQNRSDEPQEMGGGGGASMEGGDAENPENRELGGGGGGNVVNMPNNVPQPLNVGAFDPKAAAEWTFYYDQLVLWQYYCARNLLRGQDKTLLETLPPSGGLQMQPQQQQLISQISGMTPQMLRSETIRQSQQMNQPGNMNQFRTSYIPSGGGIEGENPDMGGGGGGMMMMGPGGGGFGSLGAPAPGQQISLLRETFDPQKDFESLTDPAAKSTGDEYREKFTEAAKQLDEQIYTIYMEMLKGIDKRQVTNENYEKWIKEKRQEVTNYAETWRKLEHGETIMIGGTMFLVSKDPLESVPNQSINIIKRERLTPADLLNPDGTVRSANK